VSSSHDALVADQYAPQADAYVASAVHASGADLDQIAALAIPGGRALDLGCGGGHVSYRLARAGMAVTAYDLTPAMLAAVERTATAQGLDGITTQQGTAEHMPFADASFDLVASRFSAHHWRDAEAGLREARRVLRPGGVAVFADSVSPGRAALDTFLQAVELLRDPSHARDYTAAEWAGMLTRTGFALTAVTPHRLRLEFISWTQRMATPPLLADAIRALQTKACDEVRQHFAIEADGSFLLDTLVMAAQ